MSGPLFVRSEFSRKRKWSTYILTEPPRAEREEDDDHEPWFSPSMHLLMVPALPDVLPHWTMTTMDMPSEVFLRAFTVGDDHETQAVILRGKGTRDTVLG